MIRFFMGFILTAGSVGREDFYVQCLQASDCVAGSPPSLLVTLLLACIGLSIMIWPVVDGTMSQYED